MKAGAPWPVSLSLSGWGQEARRDPFSTLASKRGQSDSADGGIFPQEGVLGVTVFQEHQRGFGGGARYDANCISSVWKVPVAGRPMVRMAGPTQSPSSAQPSSSQEGLSSLAHPIHFTAHCLLGVSGGRREVGAPRVPS